jgi:hypothetical protein
MSDEKLQAESLDLLAELIRRNLLTASVNITEPPCVMSCAILDAFPTGSRSATKADILSSYMTGTLPKKKGGPGITLSINQPFRLPAQKEAEVRAALKGVNGT